MVLAMCRPLPELHACCVLVAAHAPMLCRRIRTVTCSAEVVSSSLCLVRAADLRRFAGARAVSCDARRSPRNPCGTLTQDCPARAQAGSCTGSSAGSSGRSSGTLERDLVGSGAAPDGFGAAAGSSHGSGGGGGGSGGGVVGGGGGGDGAVFSPTNQFLNFSFKNLELLGERNREAAQAMAGLRDGEPSGPGLAPGEAEAGACTGADGEAAHPALAGALSSETDLGSAPGGSGVMSIPGSPGARGDARRGAGQSDGDPGHVLACPSRAPC